MFVSPCLPIIKGMANVTNTHSDYLNFLPLWSLVRDSVAGQKAIKDKGELYLPKPSGASDKKYKSYLLRAIYTMFTSRIAEGLYGQVFSKEPQITNAESELAKGFLENVDKSGTSLVQFSSDLIWDTIQTGRSAILVDHDPVPEGTDVNQKEHEGYRPFLRWYKAEDIIDWDYTIINNKKTLSFVNLKEDYYIRIDEFTPALKQRQRVLKLEKRDTWVYVVDVWELIKDGTKDGTWTIVEHHEPTLEGKPLDFIPIFMLPSNEPDESMLLPIAYENIGHYQLVADYRNIIHLTATPALFGINVELAMKRTTKRTTDKEGKATEEEVIEPVPLTLGGDIANFVNQIKEGYTPSIFFVEPTGNGAASSLAAIENSVKNMEAMGGNLIVKKKVAETATASQINKSNEISILGSFVLDCSIALTNAIRLALRWYGVPEEKANAVEIWLNLDYETELAGDEKVRQGAMLYRDNLISRDTFWTDFLDMSEEEAQEEAKQITQEESSVYKPVEERNTVPENGEGEE